MPLADTRRIIVHPGFHKTGTTTIQRALEENRDALAPLTRIVLKQDIPDVCHTAIDYARRPSQPRLAAFGDAVHAITDAWDRADPRHIIISAEDLCGLIPGRGGRAGYPQAAMLLRSFIRHLGAFGTPQIYLSTRASKPWLKSCHAHHVRHSTLAMDLETYITDQSRDADLGLVVAQLRFACTPATVTASSLEISAQEAQGPVTPLLDLIAAPDTLRAQLQIGRPANMSLPDHILTDLLALNRENLDQDALHAAKRALIAAHRKTTR